MCKNKKTKWTPCLLPCLPSHLFIFLSVVKKNVKFRKGQSQGGKQGHAVIFKNWNAQVLRKLSSDCREINLIISVNLIG